MLLETYFNKGRSKVARGFWFLTLLLFFRNTIAGLSNQYQTIKLSLISVHMNWTISSHNSFGCQIVWIRYKYGNPAQPIIGILNKQLHFVLWFHIVYQNSSCVYLIIIFFIKLVSIIKNVETVFQCDSNTCSKFPHSLVFCKISMEHCISLTCLVINMVVRLGR